MKRLALPFALFALAAIAPAGPAAAESKGPFIRIEVDGGRDGEHVNLRLPLAVVQIGLDMVESEVLPGGRIHLGHGDVQVSDIRKMWLALRAAGDTDLVEAEAKDGRVTVSQKDGRVLVRVTEKASAEPKIDIDVPASAVDALLSGDGESLNLKAALLELEAGRKGDFVRVQDGDSHVRIWIE